MDHSLLYISDSYNYLFVDQIDKNFAESLLESVITGVKPKTSPALWQDVEIYIRYLKRNVWSLDEESLVNARDALMVYRIKYILENLKKSEIITIFNKLFSQERGDPNNKTLARLFKDKFHTSIDDLILTQEKITIGPSQIENFDQIFAYPRWIEFSNEAIELIFEKILHNELSDEQIDYFLGAADDFKNYDEWFKIAKYILCTTHDSHVFWVAGDIINIIWKATPTDTKYQKWFKDQIFEIFWPRVGSIWPMLNQDKIDFDADEDSKILHDSISWLESLDDLKERLPDLGQDYTLINHQSPEEEFAWAEGYLLGAIDSKESSVDELLDKFFELSDLTYSRSSVRRLEQIANTNLIPLIKNSMDVAHQDEKISLIERAVRHAKQYAANLETEKANLVKLIR